MQSGANAGERQPPPPPLPAAAAAAAANTTPRAPASPLISERSCSSSETSYSGESATQSHSTSPSSIRSDPPCKPLSLISPNGADITQSTTQIADDILCRKLRQLQASDNTTTPGIDKTDQIATEREAPDFRLFDKLLFERDGDAEKILPFSATERSIRQAPLVKADIVAEHYKDLLPQYGLLGSV